MIHNDKYEPRDFQRVQRFFFNGYSRDGGFHWFTEVNGS